MNAIHETVLSSSPGKIIESGFRPAWWLPGAHAQTLWSALAYRPPLPALRRERLELPEGDFLDLAWTGSDGPTVIVLHGLEGGLRSPYICGILRALSARGFRAVLMLFRGCSGEPNRLPRSYHSGETSDLRHVIATLRRRVPGGRLHAVGYSLGGNALLKYLGESGATSGLATAVAVSVPFVLAEAADRLNRGFSRLYQWWLVRALQKKIGIKFNHKPSPVPLDRLSQFWSFWEFDDAVTAPLHGFRDAADYYQRSSARQYLRQIRTPTLILHAADDPFTTPAAVPQPEELAPDVTLELSATGGHVGFVSGTWPWAARYWLEERIPAFLTEHSPR
jgi:predicted alpha/beta-fold hydrolase